MYPLCEIILWDYIDLFHLSLQHCFFFLSSDWCIGCFVLGWMSALQLKVSDRKGKVIHPTLPICASLVVSPFQTAVMLVPPGIEYWRVWRWWKLIWGICLHAWSPSLPSVRPICHCRPGSGRSQECTGSSPESLYDATESQLRAFRALQTQSRESAEGFSLRLLSPRSHDWTRLSSSCIILRNYSSPSL